MFDIASVLKGAPGNGQEQIVYLDLDLLDPDDRNFYSLEGLDDLAGNIELLGLQQPLRVRPGEGGHYTIVSGHRRRAACMLIRDGGSEMFAGGVPCIVEYGEASEAMQELRLIYANAATRVMGPAEISKQAERVEALLYELKEEGVEFPGRMRDHVAQACKVSKSKIARLHAIRKNLEPGFLKEFDAGNITEEAAYQLSRLPEEIQKEAAQRLADGRQKKLPIANVVEEVNQRLEKYLEEMPCRAHAGGPDCHHKHEKILRSIFAPYSWQACDAGQCCRDCYHWKDCSRACQECKDRRKLEKAVEEEKEAERKKRGEAEQKLFRSQRKKQAQRLLPLIEAAGLGDDDELPAVYSWSKGTKLKTIRKAAAGDFGDDHFYTSSWSIIPQNCEQLKSWADKLNCSTDYLLGRSETPQPVSGSGTAGGWGRGLPPKPGEYLAVLGVGQEETPQASFYRVIQWTKSEGWCHCRSHAPIKETIFRWLQLPEV